MSAQIPETMLLSDLLKATGYDCPEEAVGKTVAEIISGGDAKISTNTDATIDVSAYTEPVVVEPAEGYDATKKATVTLSNIPSGADLESNHTETIDVSTYTEPVEIEPTSGKDGMEKVTVTLNNIPSGGSATAYAWTDSVQSRIWWFSFGTAPENKAGFDSSKYLNMTWADSRVTSIEVIPGSGFFEEGALYTLVKVSDSQFTITYNEQDITFTHDSAKDFTLWS